jgi:hypothetical protein
MANITGGRVPNLDAIIKIGHFQCRPIYIHYTSKAVFDWIITQAPSEQALSPKPNASRRGDQAKRAVYMVPSTQCLNSEGCVANLFLGNEQWLGSTTHVIVFAFNEDVATDYNLVRAKVSEGSYYDEVIFSGGDINFDPVTGNARMLYAGVNRFVDTHNFGPGADPDLPPKKATAYARY